MLTLTINTLRFPNNGTILAPITVGLYIKGYYQPDSAYVLIEDAVPVDVNGNITASPLPAVTIDPTLKYVLKAVNELCAFVYTQAVVINPYCPPGYLLSDDESLCSITSTVAATPPSAPEMTVAATNGAYGNFGALIYNPGYNVNGTGTFTQINPANGFWINPTDDTTDAPLNRAGNWVSPALSNQTVGFSVCVNVPANGLYYIGMGVDNYGIVNVDGNNIITQDANAMSTYLNANGFPGIGVAATFKLWHIYPVMLNGGLRVIEVIGTNVGGAAAFGAEIYNLTPAAIAAATSYASMGAGLIFSTKDFIGSNVQIGNMGSGYSCPAGYSLKFCDSPPDCVRVITTPVLY
jgi:hypothetical protein